MSEAREAAHIIINIVNGDDDLSDAARQDLEEAIGHLLILDEQGSA